MFFKDLIQNPFQSVTTLLFGVNNTFGTIESSGYRGNDYLRKNLVIKNRFSGYLETLAHYMKGDFDILVVVVILQMLPFSFMKWLLGKLLSVIGAIPGLRTITKMLVNFNRYVESWSSGSCLDLIIWAMNTYPHYEIVVYLINEMKVLFNELIPCLYGRIKGYIMSWYDATPTEFENCCISDIKEALEYVMRRNFSEKQAKDAFDNKYFSKTDGKIILKSLHKRRLYFKPNSLKQSKLKKKMKGSARNRKH
jgi:hypothetical protein